MQIILRQLDADINPFHSCRDSPSSLPRLGQAAARESNAGSSGARASAAKDVQPNAGCRGNGLALKHELPLKSPRPHSPHDPILRHRVRQHPNNTLGSPDFPRIRSVYENCREAASLYNGVYVPLGQRSKRAATAPTEVRAQSPLLATSGFRTSPRKPASSHALRRACSPAADAEANPESRAAAFAPQLALSGPLSHAAGNGRRKGASSRKRQVRDQWAQLTSSSSSSAAAAAVPVIIRPPRSTSTPDARNCSPTNLQQHLKGPGLPLKQPGWPPAGKEAHRQA